MLQKLNISQINLGVVHGGLLEIVVIPIDQNIEIMNAPRTQWSDKRLKRRPMNESVWRRTTLSYSSFVPSVTSHNHSLAGSSVCQGGIPDTRQSLLLAYIILDKLLRCIIPLRFSLNTIL